MDPENLLNTFLALVFVLALMGLIALLAKRLGLSNMAQGGAGKRLKMIESLPLDSKHRAAILQCDQTQYLVILSQSGETVIQELKVRHHKLEDEGQPFE